MKKVALVVLAALMSCTMLFALVGCGKSDEQVIKEGLSEELDGFKNPDSDMWSEIIASDGASLESVGLDTKAVIASWTQGFAYEITSVTVDGDTATAEINITCKQLYPVIETAQSKILADESNAQLSSDELTKKIAQIIMEELDNATPITTTVTVPCSKDGDTWAEGAGAEALYEGALMGS
jgi:hypothetical protein